LRYRAARSCSTAQPLLRLEQGHLLRSLVVVRARGLELLLYPIPFPGGFLRRLVDFPALPIDKLQQRVRLVGKWIRLQARRLPGWLGCRRLGPVLVEEPPVAESRQHGQGDSQPPQALQRPIEPRHVPQTPDQFLDILGPGANGQRKRLPSRQGLEAGRHVPGEGHFGAVYQHRKKRAHPDAAGSRRPRT